MTTNAATTDLLYIEEMNRYASNALAEYVDEMDAQMGVPEDDIGLLMAWKPQGSLLDLGCGAARYANLFVELGYEYAGIDFAERLVDIARIRHPTLSFHHMSYRSLTFPDNSFEALWSCCVLNHEPKHNIGFVLRELRRVLKPDGIMLIVLPWTGDSSEYMVPTYTTDNLTLYTYWTVNELTHAVGEAGFQVMEAFPRLMDGSLTLVARKPV